MHEKCLITWIGSFHNRVKEMIISVSPNRIIYLIDSETGKIKDFQLENLNIIIKNNQMLDPENPENKERISIEEIFSKSGNELFKQLFLLVEKERKKNPQKIIFIFDITAAPKNVIHIITTLSSLISTHRSPINVKYKAKNITNDPKNYASIYSTFSDKTTKLTDYRTREAEDKGGKIKSIHTPVMAIDLLNKNAKNFHFQVALFHHINSMRHGFCNTEDLYHRLIKDDKKILLMYYKSLEFIERIIERNKNIPPDEKERLRETALNFKSKKRNKKLSNKISEHIKRFKSWNIVEGEDKRTKKGYNVRKNETGEILSAVVDYLYKEIKNKDVTEN